MSVLLSVSIIRVHSTSMRVDENLEGSFILPALKILRLCYRCSTKTERSQLQILGQEGNTRQLITQHLTE